MCPSSDRVGSEDRGLTLRVEENGNQGKGVTIALHFSSRGELIMNTLGFFLNLRVVTSQYPGVFIVFNDVASTMCHILDAEHLATVIVHDAPPWLKEHFLYTRRIL